MDLGYGNGSLLNQAVAAWQQAKFIGIDVCEQRRNKIKRQFPQRVIFRRLDLLDGKSLRSNFLNKLVGHTNIAICNPPFLAYKNNILFQELCQQANMLSCQKLSRVTTDVVFLLHNIRLLKEGGTLGIILPDGLITNKNFQNLRETLLTNHQVEMIIQLPDRAFQGIEVRTHIMILRKNRGPTKQVKIMSATQNGNVEKKLTIPAVALGRRMDYNCWHWSNQNQPGNKIVLGDMGVHICRGSRTRAFFAHHGMPHIHTSDLGGNLNNGWMRWSPKNHSALVLARTQDILMARVGKRCLGKVSQMTDGSLPITDCVYRISIPTQSKRLVKKALFSDQANAWFRAHAHGVCAQVISKEDLLNFPVN